MPTRCSRIPRRLHDTPDPADTRRPHLGVVRTHDPLRVPIRRLMLHLPQELELEPELGWSDVRGFPFLPFFRPPFLSFLPLAFPDLGQGSSSIFSFSLSSSPQSPHCRDSGCLLLRCARPPQTSVHAVGR